MKTVTTTIPKNLNIKYIDSASNLKDLKKEIRNRMWALAWDCKYWKDAPTKKDVTKRIDNVLKLVSNFFDDKGKIELSLDTWTVLKKGHKNRE